MIVIEANNRHEKQSCVLISDTTGICHKGLQEESNLSLTQDFDFGFEKVGWRAKNYITINFSISESL